VQWPVALDRAEEKRNGLGRTVVDERIKNKMEFKRKILSQVDKKRYTRRAEATIRKSDES
jgi:hypothetical protein